MKRRWITLALTASLLCSCSAEKDVPEQSPPVRADVPADAPADPSDDVDYVIFPAAGIKLVKPDGFEDADGCPESDNDLDGIEDKYDRCPDLPENYNGVDDEDGCPESQEEDARSPKRSGG